MNGEYLTSVSVETDSMSQVEIAADKLWRRRRNAHSSISASPGPDEA
jgi:hypothetical protein